MRAVQNALSPLQGAESDKEIDTDILRQMLQSQDIERVLDAFAEGTADQ